VVSGKWRRKVEGRGSELGIRNDEFGIMNYRQNF
jgi:hypothetical protein